jgi:glycosyltransferase involved in cell wall biosynthesis
MVFAEALQRGLPVIGTTAGAIPEVVPPEAGILVPPDDVATLAGALRRLIGDRLLRLQLAAGAREAAKRLPRWPETGQRVSESLRRV